MAGPMLTPAPVVTEPAAVVRDRCDHQGPCRQVQHDRTGLIVRPNQRLAKIARGHRDSADHTHVSRLLADAPWRADAVTRRRLRFRLQQPTPHRRRRRASRVVLDDPRCAPVGSLCASGDRPDHHREGPSPLAHHPVTRVSVRGPGCVALGLRR